MIYTFGYQGKTLDDLVKIIKDQNITHLIDVRSKPVSRHKGYVCFNRKRLDASIAGLGVKYSWKGKILGGFSEISEKANRELEQFQQDKTCLLMCMEAD